MNCPDAHTSAAPVVKVARDLREIEDLYEHLLVQAIHHADSRLMPGGEAMVALGPVASPSEWADLVAYAELRHMSTCDRLDHSRCRFNDWLADEDDQEAPLQTLLFWSEQWRAQAGYALDRPTMRTEANFLRGRLDWAWDNEPAWDAFAADVRKARARLENLLHAGERVAFKGAPCMYDECSGARLIRKTVPTRDDSGEKAWKLTDWHCPKCKRTWDEETYARNIYAAVERTNWGSWSGLTWCTSDRAARRVARPAATIRSWITRGEVAAVCELNGRRTFVCLEDVIQRDRLARERAAKRRVS